MQVDTNMAALLCVASGIADAIGYVQAGVFAANMTGNTVLAGVSLAHADFTTALERGMTFVTFFAGAMLGRLSLRYAGNAWLPLFLEGSILALSTLLTQPSRAVLWIALAMGLQATAVTRFKGAAISTIVLTSTLARLGEAALDFIATHKALATADQNNPTALLAITWAAYAIGAVLAVLLLQVTSLPLLAASAVVLALSFSCWHARR
ncbi:MAG TPA: YoaK family protein [Casimicrobiaceae bacterium]|nr:YoaK family protein [Casimicrobiaceae bacterium]